MPEKRQEYISPKSTATMPTGWRSVSAFLLAFCCIFVAARFVPAWWSGQKMRPLLLTGQMIWMLTIMGLMWRRKLKLVSDASFQWYQFSLAEMFVIATGLAIFMGLSGADYSQQRAKSRHREQLQMMVSQVLGPEGRLGFESDDSLTISVCDRTFDDQRLTELANLIHDDAESNGVSRVLFGTGPLTAGMARKWPGITDASVETLLRWRSLTMLVIEGASITAEGRKRLLKLKELDELSQTNLSRDWN